MGVAQTRPTPSCTYAAESTQASRDVECELQQFEVANVRPTDKKLGEGSYGTVVQVMIPGATCAAKIIHEALLSTSGENTVVDKFKRECLLMSSLRHPHVVEFLGVWYPPSSRFPALVMEKLVISLHELLEANSNIPLAIKHSILHDVARGLLYLHSHDPPIIHRDLTAKNVLLNSDMVAKVADLGVARMLEILPSQSASPLTQTPGTTVYMPPEALEPGNVRSYGKMLDIFSFGHLSLFTLTQVFPKVKAPKYTDRSTAKHIARSELKRRADSIEQIHSTLGQQHVLVKLVEQCLHDLPENRPPIEKVIEELDKAKTQISDDYGEMTRLELYKKIFSANGELEQVEKQLQNANEELTRVKEERDSANEEVAQLKAQLNSANTEVMQVKEQLRSANGQLAQVKEQHKSANGQLAQVKEQHKSANEEVAQLKAQFDSATEEVAQLKAQYDSANMELTKVKEQLERHKQSLMSQQLGQRNQERSMKSLTENYEYLFTTKGRQVAKDLSDQGLEISTAKQVLCNIFEESYKVCSMKVLDLIHHELSQLHVVHTTTDAAALKRKGDIYGELLNFTDITPQVPVEQISKRVKLLREGQIKGAMLDEYISTAIKLAWNMVTTQPPMVIDTPPDFSEEVHERQYTQWDEKLESYNLSYMRPVLFYSCNGELALKGWVGNKKLSI